MKIAALVLAVIVLSGCGAGSAEPTATDPREAAPPASAENTSPGLTQRTEPSGTPAMVVSEECSQAFGDVLPELNSIEAMESRLPALEACSSLDEWVAAGAAHPKLVQALVSGAWDEPIASLNVLGEACAFLDAAAGASLCEELSDWCESHVENLSQPPCQVERPMAP